MHGRSIWNLIKCDTAQPNVNSQFIIFPFTYFSYFRSAWKTLATLKAELFRFPENYLLGLSASVFSF